MRILNINENKKEKKKKTKREVILGVSIISIAITGMIFLNVNPAFIFNIPFEGVQEGWATINVRNIKLDGYLEDLQEGYAIDLYHANNGTRFASGLSSDDFPRFFSTPTTFLVNSTTGEFQFYYSLLLTSISEDLPFENNVTLKREAPLGMVSVQARIYNVTDPYGNMTIMNLSCNESNPIEFLNLQEQSLLQFDISGILVSYTWGSSTIVPSFLMETLKNNYPLSFSNGYNRIGLNLAIDCPINVSILLDSEGSQPFFSPLQAHSVNVSDGQTNSTLWVVPLPEVVMNREITFQFDSNHFFNDIYLWSGWLDDFNSSFHYNYYQLAECSS